MTALTPFVSKDNKNLLRGLILKQKFIKFLLIHYETLYLLSCKMMVKRETVVNMSNNTKRRLTCFIGDDFPPILSNSRLLTLEKVRYLMKMKKKKFIFFYYVLSQLKNQTQNIQSPRPVCFDLKNPELSEH